MTVDRDEFKEKLTGNNKKFFNEIEEYLMSNDGLDRFAINDFLSSLQMDILDAQEDGKSAKEFFGADALTYVKDIESTLPKSSKNEKINNFLFSFGVCLFFLVLYLFLHLFIIGENSVGLLQIVLLIISLYIWWFCDRKLTRTTTFKSKRAKNISEKVSKAILIIPMFFGNYLPKGYVINLTIYGKLGLILGCIVILILIFKAFNYFDNKERSEKGRPLLDNGKKEKP